MRREKIWHDCSRHTPRRLADTYRFPGFRPSSTVHGIFGDPKARVVRLLRRGKKRAVGSVDAGRGPSTTTRCARIRDLSCGDTRVYLEGEVRRVWCHHCGTVKQEKLPWVADTPFYPKRCALVVGRRCRTATIQDVARELQGNWRTVKELDKQYLREQLRRTGRPGPKSIGVDEIAIRKGHTDRIVVSDLGRRRAIWLGGTDRSEASMDMFYVWLGAKKSKRIRLAVMEMGKPFRTAALKAAHAPQAKLLFDKFSVLRHLTAALDHVRQKEYGRLRGKDRQFIKGQQYTLLSHRANLSLEGRRALKKLLHATKRLPTAYVLKESFGQL